MSATIYSGIEGIEAPKTSFSNMAKCREDYDNYIETLKAKCKEGFDDENVGEVIKFPVADGYALYMVYSMNPLELIHIDIMDGYQFEYVDLMTPEKVMELIKREKALKKLFS